MKFLLVILLLSVISCSAAYKFNKVKPAFDRSGVLYSFTSVADMNDSYFVIKENNFVEFYRQLFDSVKNSSYPGKYSKNGDTLLLQFYNKKAVELLGNKAIIQENEIKFFK